MRRRKKYIKRLAAVLLALLLCSESFPFYAFADCETEFEETIQETQVFNDGVSDVSELTESDYYHENEDNNTCDDVELSETENDEIEKYVLSFGYDETAPEDAPMLQEPIVVSSGEEISFGIEPSVNGFVFEGWSLNGNEISEEFVMPEENVELIGSWSEYMPSGSDTDTAIDGTIANAAWDVCIFPEGTSLLIDTVDDVYATEIGRRALGNDAVIINAVAYDISFIEESDGRSLQPYDNGTVYLELELPFALSGDQFYLVHAMEDGQLEFISSADVSVQEMEDGSLQAIGVSFEAAAFSVYTLITTGETGSYARRTYEFYANDTLFASQTVTKDDFLADPGLPTISEKAEFMGWYRTSDESRNPITLDELRRELSEASIYESETISLSAIILQTHTISYLDEDNNVIKTVKVYDGDDFSVSENYEPKNKDRIFKGWWNGEALYSVGERIDSVSCDLVLKPDLKRTFLLTFHINCEDGSISAIPPVTVEEGANLSTCMPDAGSIIRPGYVFAGWFRGVEENGSIVLEGDEIVDGQVTGQETFYAKWDAAEKTSFTVRIWKQNVEDDFRVGLTEESPFFDPENNRSTEHKTYVFDRSFQLYGTTGTEMSSTGGLLDCLNTDEGFYRSRIEYVDGDGKETGVISSNGKSEVNVYYDRQIWAMTFVGVQKKEYVEDSEATSNVYGLEGESYFPVYRYSCDVYSETTENEPITQFGTDDGISFYPIYYLYAVSYSIAQDNAGQQYRISENGKKYVRIYYQGNKWRLTNDTNGEEYIGVRYKAGGSKNQWVKANDKQYGVKYSGTRYLSSKEYRWFKGNSITDEPYSDTRYVLMVTSSDVMYCGLFGQDFQKYGYIWPEETAWSEISFTDSFTGLQSFPVVSEDGTVRSQTLNAENNGTVSTTIIIQYYRIGEGEIYERVGSSSYILEDGQEYYDLKPFKGMDLKDYYWDNSTNYPGDDAVWISGRTGENGKTSCGDKGSNTVLHLRYEQKVYNLVFKDPKLSEEQSVLKTIEIPYGSSLQEYQDQAPDSMNKADFVFTGWYLDPQCTMKYTWNGKMCASDKIVYAGWEKCCYRVVINLCDEAASPAEYSFKRSLLVPALNNVTMPLPKRAGYQYNGLYSDPDYEHEFLLSTVISAATTDMDLCYLLSDEYENGLMENGIIIHDAEIEADHVAGKLSLYVKWERLNLMPVRIAYDVNGGSDAPTDLTDYSGQNYAVAHSVCTPPDGKAFLCWTYRDTTTGKDVEVYPGHYFPLQQAEITISEENGSRTQTIILKAKYVQKQLPGEVTVIFDPNGGIGSYRITVPSNQTFSVPGQEETGVEREGWLLVGWNTKDDRSGESFDIGENVAANMTDPNVLYAVWERKITILFTVNQKELGSVSINSVTLAEHSQETITVTATAGEHSMFSCWVLNGETVSTDRTLNLSMSESGWMAAEYQAVFEQETLSVSFVTGAEDVENMPDMQHIPYGERVIRPRNPLRNGFRFVGWKNGDTDYDFALPVTKKLVLTAQWKQEFYVSYSVCSSQNGVKLDVAPTDNDGYLPGETVSLKAYPISPEGYDIFDGWYTDDIRIHDGSFVMPANNVVLRGTFTPISYEISYELNGGRAVEINPTSYTVESSAILLNRPIKEGYVFSGWIGSNGTEAQTEVTIPAESTGDRSYTATWSPSLNTTYHVVVHYPVDWIMPESIEDAEVNLEQRTVSYACTGMTGSVVNTRAFRSSDDLRLTYDSEHPDNVPQGNIEPDGTLVLHVFLKRVEYLYTVQFCLRGTEKTVATKTGIAEPDSSGTAVTEVSLENAVFLDEYANYVSHMAIAGDNQVTVNKDNANVVVPIVIKVCVDRMDNRELYANGKEQYGYSIIEITGTAFSSDSEDGHITVSGLLPGDSMTIDFIPASGTNVGTYLPVYNGASFYTGESRVQYYTFDGFDPQTMGRLTILETVTVTWINGDDVLCVDPYVPPGSVPIYYAETPIKLSDFRYKYTFIGWNPEVGPVSKDTTYEAVFSKSFRLYTVTWENWDGTVAWQKDYNYGSTPMYGGPGQVKPEDAGYTYTFSSWTPAISEVDGNVVYKPVFTRTPRKYLVTYELNGVPYGSVLQKPFGETIMLSEDPQLEGYSFSGWSSEDVLIENRTFTMPSKNVIIVGSFSKIEKQVFDPNNLTEAQKAIAATGLTYNGTEQDLVTSPTSLPEGYTGLRFSTDNGETWNAIIPKATDAGEYLVLVQYVGDSRHEDFITDGISVAVEKAVITSFRASVFEELVYTGEERVLLAAVSDLPEGASVEYLVCDTDNHIYRDWSDELPYAVIPGSYQVYYRINGGKNYQSVLQTRIDNGSDQNTVITKADQNLPRKPSAVATDAHSITVDRTVIGQEYVLLPAGHVPSEDDWTENGRQASDGATLVFDNLSACQNYVVYTRKAANDCYNASNYIASETVTMPKESQSIPTSAVVATATCTSITVKSAYPSQEYSLDLGNSWLKASEGSNELTFENLKPNTEYRLISRMAETDTCSASEATDPITVKTLTGKIKTEVRTSGAATLDIAVTGLDEQLAKKLITTDEIERVLYGQTAAVYLLVSNNELSMSTSEKVLIEEAAKEKNKDAVVCMSLDISLYKQLESESPIAITSIGTDTIEITLEIPKQFRNTDANTERSFYIVRVHAGKAEILQPTVTGNSLTFSTGRFSTYAIFYVDRMESVSAAAGTESASGTATLASATGSATGTSVPTAASVSVTGTVAGNATYAGAGTTLAESAANEIKTETGEKTAENRTEWTDGIENRSNEPNTDIQRKDIIYENNYSTDDNSISGLFLQSARRTLLLIPLLGLIVTGYAAVRRRREKRSDEE